MSEQRTARNPAKEEQILAGAKEVFLEVGFEGASTDEIARRANVSKGTLYAYFPDKRALFAAFMRAELEDHALNMFSAESEAHIEQELRRIALAFVTMLLSPEAQGLFRTAVAEGGRFPDLSRAFYEAGPGLGARRLAEIIAGACARGELVAEDAALAAHQFIVLCRADLFYKKVFGVIETPSSADIKRIADGAVRVFMAAFGARSPSK